MTRGFLCFAAMLALSGCGDQSMTQQNRYGTYTAAASFPNGTEAQPLPEGVMETDAARTNQSTKPPQVDAALIARGRERFDIFCSPCHGFSGNGDGIVVQRGFPHPPSYHSERLRRAPSQHLFDVITDGYGVMYSFASRVEPRDRWAIVAYVRALQESQRAKVAYIPDDLRSKLP
jgi:mono/diheme cytochrome c family protein